MNKTDLLAEKLPHSPLGDYFPDYEGGDNFDAACDYLHRFVSLRPAGTQLYTHFARAYDTRQIPCRFFLSCFLLQSLTRLLVFFAVVLSAVQGILLREHIRRLGNYNRLGRHRYHVGFPFL